MSSPKKRDTTFRQKLRSILISQALPESLFVHDRQGRFVEVNRRACESLGYSEDELLGLTVMDVELDFDRQGAQADWNKIRPGETHVLHGRYRRKDGSAFPVEIRLGVLELDGEPFYSGLVRDITGHPHLEETLQESKAKYQVLFESANDGIFVQEIAHFTFVECNARGAAMYGLPPQQVIGRSPMAFSPERQPDGRLSSQVAMEKIQAALDGQPQSFEWQALRSDGNLLDVEVTLNRIEMGGAPFLQAIVHDIAIRKSAEAALRESEARYRLVVDNLKEVIFQTDAQGLWTFLNPAWTEVTGFSVESTLGTQFLDYVHPDDRQRNLELFQPLMQREKDYCRHEIRYLRRTGGFCRIEVFARLTLDGNGNIAGTSGTLSDITERKQAEEALAETRERLRHLANQVPGALYQFRLYPDGRTAMPFASDGFYDMYELTPEQLREDASLTSTRWHPANAEAIRATIVESARTLETWHHEYRVQLPKAGVKWRLGHARPERLADGSTLWHGYISDITARKLIETRLRENEDRLRLALDAAQQAWFELDIGTGTVISSPEYGGLLGYAPGEYHSSLDNWLSNIHPDDIRSVRSKFQEALASDQTTELTYRRRAKSGDWIWISSLGKVAERDADGNPRKMIGIHMNVTKSKTAELLLRESEERLRLAMGVARQGSFDLNLVTGDGVASPETAKLLGYDPAEYHPSKKIWLDSVHPDDLPAVLAGFRDALQSGQSTELIYRRKRQSGDWIWTSSIGKVVERDAQGQPLRIAGIHMDITERKQAEAALRLSASVFSNSHDGIMITDARVRIVDANPSFTRITGYTREEVVGKTPRLFASGRHGPEFYAAMWDSIRRRNFWQGEIWNRRKDGAEYVERLTISTVQNAHGEVTQYVGVLSDITAIKRQEAALQDTVAALTAAQDELRVANATLEDRVRTQVARNMAQERLLIQQSRLAAMGEMIGNIAHQWRQPLSTLAVMLANVKDAYDFGELDAETLDKSMADSGRLIQKMSSTIDDFRDFFKPDREKQVFSLREAMESTLHLVDAGFKSANIAMYLEDGEDIQAYGFPNEFSQVLLNILNNAKDAIQERDRRGGTIRASLAREGRTARLALRDDAGGIPETVLPKIFDPYFTTKEKGTGIGLYMSKMIMEHMDGGIEARNVEGGAEFAVFCPMA